MVEKIINSASVAFSKVWQLPILLLGLAVLGTGLYLVWPQFQRQSITSLDPLPGGEAVARAEAEIKVGRFKEATAILQELMRGSELLAAGDRGRFFMALADAAYGTGRQEAEVATRSVTEAGIPQFVVLYEQAQAEGAKLDDDRRVRMADALAHTGQWERALASFGQASDVKWEWIERHVSWGLKSNVAGMNAGEKLVHLALAEPGLEIRDEARLTAAYADWLIDVYRSDEGVGLLLRLLARAEGRMDCEALKLQLARAYLQSGDHQQSIGLLEAMIHSQGGDPAKAASVDARLVYQLGVAYLQSVNAIDQRLASRVGSDELSYLRADRLGYLERAKMSFNAVIDEYESRGATLNEASRRLLRDSYFHRGECAYRGAEFDGPTGAITLYEIARARYLNDPVSVVADVQIANSYAEMSQWRLAAEADQRARLALRKISEPQMQQFSLPMARQDWQRWLLWTGRSHPQDADGADTATPPRLAERQAN